MEKSIYTREYMVLLRILRETPWNSADISGLDKIWAMALSAPSLFGIARVVELVDTHV